MNLTIGAKNDLVLQLQKALKAKGFDPGPLDASFGPLTRKAVVAYQQSAKLVADGVVGPKTQAGLGLRFKTPTIPKARSQFKQLQLSKLENDSVTPGGMEPGNTEFEELVCVGYQPQLDRLVAIVDVKQTSGYEGPICGGGSVEYVRFFVDWNNDGHWSDAGVTRFIAHDIPQYTSIFYAVSVPLAPIQRRCTIPFLPRVRAILSWDALPPAGDPDHLPVWGHALDGMIQIQARPQWLFETIPGLSSAMVELINANIEQTLAQQQLLFGAEIFAQPNLTPTLAATYAKAQVPPLRYAAGLFAQLTKAKSTKEIVALAPAIEQQLGIDDFGALIEQWQDPGDGDQSYEELRCLGYDRDRQSLSAVIKIKQQAGYGGDLCSQGSREYVTFWVWDEDAAAWERLGTASVTVYDVPVPEQGLDYEVFLPVDFTRYQRPCDQGFRTLQIRAILSWNSPITNPEQVPYWGGREEGVIEVKPGPSVAAGVQQPFLESVGDIAVCNIDPVTGLANGLGVITAGAVEDAPFGGELTITGFFANPPTSLSGVKPKYRISVRPYEPTLSDSANPWQPLTSEFRIRTSTSIGGGVAISTWMTQTIDSEGYYTYQEVFGPSEWRVVAGRVLARWQTGTPHAIYEIKLEGKDALGGMVTTGTIVCEDGSSRQVVRVHLDNERPRAELRITGVIRQGETEITPAADCDKFRIGDRLVGTYVAFDEHFGRAALILQPNPTPTPPAPIQAPRLLGASSYAGGLNPKGELGGEWELDTTNMRACGYTLTLSVVDRTIVGSSTLTNHRSSVTVGFCLEQPS